MEIMTEILTSIGAVFTQAVDWMGELVTVITADPVLIILCIGLLKRLTSAI